MTNSHAAIAAEVNALLRLEPVQLGASLRENGKASFIVSVRFEDLEGRATIDSENRMGVATQFNTLLGGEGREFAGDYQMRITVRNAYQSAIEDLVTKAHMRRQQMHRFDLLVIGGESEGPGYRDDERAALESSDLSQDPHGEYFATVVTEESGNE